MRILEEITRRHVRTGTATLIGLVTLMAFAGCGLTGPPIQVGDTPTDSAMAFIRAREAEDGAQVEAMLAEEFRQAVAMFGESAATEIASKRREHGAPVHGLGRVLKVEEAGSTATVHVAIVYDNGCPTCRATEFLPEWAPPGSYVDANQLTLQKQPGAKWIISMWEDSPYLTEQREATRVAIVQTMGNAQALSALATREAIPTPTATPAPRYLTALGAHHAASVADLVRGWGNDAILFQIYDRTDQGRVPFGYHPKRNIQTSRPITNCADTSGR